LHALLKKDLWTLLAEVGKIAFETLKQIKGHCFNNIKRCYECG
jgi:hypothetical protein